MTPKTAASASWFQGRLLVVITLILEESISQSIERPVEQIERNEQASSVEILNDFLEGFRLVERIADGEHSLAVYRGERRNMGKSRTRDRDQEGSGKMD